MAGAITNVTVTLRNLNHTWPADVDVLLVGPAGQKAMIFSDVGGGGDLNNVTVTLSDAAAAALTATGQIVSGTYKPTDVEPGESGELDTFSAPAPGGPYTAPLSVFNGLSPNGAWSLYVVDDSAGDSGNIASGWSLNIATMSTNAPPAAPTIVDGPAILPNGHFYAAFLGTPNVPYTIKHAPDVNGPWQTLTTITSDTNGLIKIDDIPAAAPPRRFYRVVYP
jgi:subtilisin-like proprotein convertase family protein